MLAYKAFHKDLTCTLGKGKFQYKEGVLYTEETAHARETGFHSAEDPLDTLTYYSNMDEAVYYLVEATGNINEDGNDTKIASTELKLIQKLSIYDFVMAALQYQFTHPQRDCNNRVSEETVAGKWFGIARGKNPRVKGPKGTVIAVLKEYADSVAIEDFNIWVVGEDGVKEDTWYSIDGEERVDEERTA